MKKNWLIFCLSFLLWSGVGAEFYPEKINNGNEFTKWSHFENLYEKNYKDVDTFDLNEIKDRVCEYPDIDCEKKLSIKNFEDLLQLTVVGNVGEKLGQERFRQYMEGIIRYELELYQLEQSLARHGSMELIYTDGDGYENDSYTQKTSPFDVSVALNEIDELFFGEKKLNFYPHYMKKKSAENSSEPWLDRREDKLPAVSDFSENDVSFSAIAQHVGKIFQEEINPFSLVCSKNTKNIFEYPFCTTPIGIPKLAVSTFPQPSASSDIPASEAVLSTDFGEQFNGILKKIVSNADCETQDLKLERTQNNTKFGGLDEIEFCEQQRQYDLLTQLAAFERSSFQNNVEDEYNALRISLNSFLGFLEFFNDYSDQQINRWKSINQHTKG